MRREGLGIILVFLTTVGTVLGALYYEGLRAHHRKTIELVAHAPERGNWSPRELVVREGELV